MPVYPSNPPAAASLPNGGLPALPPHLDPRGKHRTGGPSGAAGRAALITVRILATLLSMLLLLAFGTYWWNYHSLTGGANRLNIFGSSGRPTHDIDGKAQNILIVGNDDRQTATDAELRLLGTGRDGGSLNTDTMMLVHVPANGSKATLISLPRDSYVNIPGFGMNKINAAYGFGYNATAGSLQAKREAGARVTATTVENLTGLTLDHFVQVDLLGFYRISNAIGGVSVNMCQAVREPESGIHLHKGVNVIKGTQALAFVRQRYNFPNGLGDLDRVERQRYFLTAAFRKLTSAGVLLNPIKLNDLFNAVKNSMYVDSGLDLLTLARQLENLSADNIIGQTIPTDGFADQAVGSVVVVSPAEVRTFINRMVGTGDPKIAAANTVPPSTVTVDVMNAGSGVNGIATQSSQVLRQQGFGIGAVGNNSTPSTSTVIEYADGMQAQAKTLAAYIPGAAYQMVGSLQHVTLLLGSDGLTVKAAAKAPPTTSSRPATSSTPTPTVKPKAIDAGCIN